MSDALLVGATGLVGGAVVEQMRERPLTILARRAVESASPHHHPLVAPPERWGDMIAADRPATLICCLGTTIRQAGSQAAFRAVDHDLVLAAARGAKLGGAKHLIAVSSVGASPEAGNFYLRTKGETEEGLGALGFDRVDFLRPGLLTGKRDGPPRLGEGIAKIAAPLADALLWGSLRRYRSIHGETVARAIAALAGETASGVHIHENDAIHALAD